jgi:hypothetical protein
MTDSTFNECFKLLEDYHSRPQSASAKKRYREEFLGVPYELFIEAVRGSMRKYAPGRFPSIDELGKFIADAAECFARRRRKTAPEARPDPEESKAVWHRLGAELERLDREKEKREAEKREQDRQDHTQRINAKKQLLKEQELKLKENSLSAWRDRKSRARAVRSK